MSVSLCSEPIIFPEKFKAFVPVLTFKGNSLAALYSLIKIIVIKADICGVSNGAAIKYPVNSRPQRRTHTHRARVSRSVKGAAL